MSNSFDKSFRLLTSNDFNNLKIDSDSLGRSGLCLRLYYKKNNNISEGKSRIGISVSRKVANSCKRNRLKRLIREYFRKSDIKFLSTDMLFVVLPSLYKKFKTVELAENHFKYALGQLSNMLVKKRS